MITFKHKGDFKKTLSFLERNKKLNYDIYKLETYAKEGVKALSLFTPIDTGKTSASWDYVISKTDGNVSIIWTNSNVNNGVNIALIIQYGHGVNGGGYIEGVDYINPAIKPVFDKIMKHVWEEVTIG